MKFIKFISFLLPVAFIFTACQKELTFEEGAAAGTLKKDASGDCMPVIVNGNFVQNVTLGATNYIDVKVDITTLGSYDIKSDTVNGYSFRGTGQAALLGLNTIRLKGTGKPLIAPSTDVFKVKFGTSSCEINVSVVTGTGGGPVIPPTGTDSIVCNIDGVYKTFKINDTAQYDMTSVPGYNVLNIFGQNNAAGDETFALGAGLPGTATPTAGTTYTATQFPANFVGGVYQNATDVYLVASGFTTPPAPVFQIRINTITSTKVTGTFSGAIPDIFGLIPDIQVTNGIFSVTIYP